MPARTARVRRPAFEPTLSREAVRVRVMGSRGADAARRFAAEGLELVLQVGESCFELFELRLGCAACGAALWSFRHVSSRLTARTFHHFSRTPSLAPGQASCDV